MRESAAVLRIRSDRSTAVTHDVAHDGVTS